jgi:hypothetical protein
MSFVTAPPSSCGSTLLAVPGIGPVKLERHGDAVLDLVRQHAAG